MYTWHLIITIVCWEHLMNKKSFFFSFFFWAHTWKLLFGVFQVIQTRFIKHIYTCIKAHYIYIFYDTHYSSKIAPYKMRYDTELNGTMNNKIGPKYKIMKFISQTSYIIVHVRTHIWSKTNNNNNNKIFVYNVQSNRTKLTELTTARKWL